MAKGQVRKGLRILRNNKTIRDMYRELEAHYTGQEYAYRLCSLDWEMSKEHREVKDDIEQRRQNGEYISYGTEQVIMYRAEQKYIREHRSL